MGDAFDQPARVDKDQSGPVRLDLSDELVVDRRPNILPNDRAQFGVGHFDAQLHLAPVTDVDNRALGRAVGAKLARSDQQPRHLFDRLLRRAEADALKPLAGQGIEPLERERQMGAAFVLRHRMDLVDDQCLGAL